MIQRIIGGAVGALATWLILVWNNVNSSVAVTAAVVGAVAAFLWPIIVGFFLARRVKQRREDADPGRGRAAGRRAEQAGLVNQR